MIYSKEHYRRIVRTAKDSPDGDTPTVVSVIGEGADGYLVMVDGWDATRIVGFYWHRDKAIEAAMLLARCGPDAVASEPGIDRDPSNNYP